MHKYLLTKNEMKMLLLGGIMFVVSVLCQVPWLACGIYGSIILYYARKSNVDTIICFIYLIIFQNIVLIIFSDFIDKNYIFIMLLIKELMIYLVIVVGGYRLYREKSLIDIIKKHKKKMVMAVVLFVIIIMNIFRMSTGWFSIFSAIRQLMIPFTCFLMGYLLKITEEGYNKVYKNIVYFTIFLTVFGIIEMILPENIIWQKLNYGLFLEKKQGIAPVLYKGVTANFYTWDLGSLMRRLVSITADPLATAHLICLGLLVNLTVYFKSGCQKNKIYVCVNMLLLGGCILGLSKGTVVYLAVFVVGILYHKFQKNISKKKMMLFISILIFVAVILMIVMYTNTEVPTAITNHIDGFINGLKDSNLFGKGLGIAGAATHAISGIDIANSESYFGVVLNQIGYIGTGIMIVFWVSILKSIINTYLCCKDLESLMYVIITVGLSIDMLFSESSVAIIGTGLYFILLGQYCKKINTEKICKINS